MKKEDSLYIVTQIDQYNDGVIRIEGWKYKIRPVQKHEVKRDEKYYDES